MVDKFINNSGKKVTSLQRNLYFVLVLVLEASAQPKVCLYTGIAINRCHDKEVIVKRYVSP